MSILGRKLVRDIGRRRGQFIAIMGTVLLGVALFAASSDAYQNLLASYRQLFDRTGFAALTILGGDEREIASSVNQLDGVSAVTRRSVADVALQVGGTTLVGRAIGMPADTRPAVDDVLVLDGEYLSPNEPGGVLVERHMADHFELHPGDSIRVLGTAGWIDVKVRGVVGSAEYIWPARSRQEVLTLPDQFGVLFVPQAVVDELPPAAVHDEVLVGYAGAPDDPALTERVVGLARAAGASDAFTRAEQPSNATLAEDIDGFGELSILFPLMFLGAAGLATYVLLSRMVISQRPQIGLLLAVGLRRRRVFGHYLGFGLLAGLLGAIPGALIGVAAAGLITGIYTGVLAIPVTVVELRPATLVLGLGFGAVAGCLAALLPSLRAAHTSPAAAMSGQVGAGNGRRSLLERLLPWLARMPARWRMVLRGIGRSPARSLTTVGGVMIAVTLVFVSWAMLDTVQVLIDRQFGDAQREDAVAYLPGGATADAMAAIAALPGVDRAEPMASLPVTIDHDGRRYTTTLVAFPADTEMHGFLADGDERPLPAQGLLVGGALHGRIGVAPGDRITLLGRGLDGVQTTVAGFVTEPLGTYAYASLEELRRLAGPGLAPPDTVNLRLRPDAARDDVLRSVRNTDGVAAVTDAQALRRAADSLVGLFYAFVGAMLVLGAVMAFAVLFNLMSANIAERITELASLRASGMRGGELARMITAENVLLTVAGIVPGLVVGYAGAAEFMASFSSDLFTFDLAVRPLTFLLTALGILAAAVISQLPILRAVRSIDIARVVRERAL